MQSCQLDAQYQQQQKEGNAGDANGAVDHVESSIIDSGILESTAPESEQAPNTPVQEDTANHNTTEIRDSSLRGSHPWANGHAEWKMAAQDNSLSPSSIPGKLIH